MKQRKILALVLIVACFMLIMTGCGGTKQPNDSQQSEQNTPKEPETLNVYSGAGLRKAMDEIAEVFKEKYGVEVTYNYAGSAQLLSQMEVVKEGDVFVPGDQIDMEKAIEKGFAKDYKQVAYHIPAIAVPKGNPANIKELADLAKPGVKVLIGDEKACAIGKLAIKIFKKNNLLEDIEKNIVAKDATVNEVVTHTVMKQADASIITEDNGINVEGIELIKIPEEQNLIEIVPVGVLTFSEKPELAQKFADFVASAEGKAIFEKHGFKPVK
jgi:molybdate transport system substrate-binding protein